MLVVSWQFSTIMLAMFYVATVGAILSESQFTVLPKDLKIIEGSTAVFDCEVDAMDTVEYSWTFNGDLIIYSKRVYITESSLYILNVNYTVDSGDYVCIVTSSATGAREATPPATLDIIWINAPIVARITNMDVHSLYRIISLKKGDDKNLIILDCQTQGTGNFEVKWLRNGKELRENDNTRFLRKIIILRPVSVEFSGTYSCVARNDAGEMESNDNFILDTDCGRNYRKLCRGKRDKEISTNENIRITRQPDDMTVTESNSVVMNCGYELKDPSYGFILKWLKDKKLFRQMNRTTANANLDNVDSRFYINRSSGSLVFTSTETSDNGAYQCQFVSVNDEVLLSSEIAVLKVIETLKFNPKPTSKNLELGTLAKVHCRANGTPMPIVKWELENSPELPNSIEDINGTLTFNSVTIENKGNYTCIASNSQGNISATIHINVVVAPRLTFIPEGTLYVTEMETATVHCVAFGTPKPIIQWDKESTLLYSNKTVDDRFKIHHNGTLVINKIQLDDEGKYGCTIGNTAGLRREEKLIVVRPKDSLMMPGESTEEGSIITRAVLITMTVAFAYIVLVVGLMLWCRHRRSARKARLIINDKECEIGSPGKEINGEVEPCLPDDAKLSSVTTKKSSSHNNTKTNSTNTMDNNVVDATLHNGEKENHDNSVSDETIDSNKSRRSTTSQLLDGLQISRKSLLELIQVGKCDFGDVLIGKINNSDIIKHSQSDNSKKRKATYEISEKKKKEISSEELNEIKPENEYKLAMIKTLNKVKDESACTEFRRQIELFRTVSSSSVVRLFGLCREKDPHYLVLEYTDWGDLKQFLLATSYDEKDTEQNKPPPLKIPQILALAHQIGRGMDAIYKSRLIHKDLATRNCIISSDFSCKISLPGLNRDKYSKEYYKLRNQLIPLRWTAPECIQDDDYSIKSDVFSYGVLVWELFTHSKSLPHSNISNDNFVNALQNNKLEWKVADNTPEDLRKILSSCWNIYPKERPSFSQLVNALTSSLKSEYPKDGNGV